MVMPGRSCPGAREYLAHLVRRSPTLVGGRIGKNTRVVIGDSGAQPLRPAGRLLPDTNRVVRSGRWMRERAGVGDERTGKWRGNAPVNIMTHDPPTWQIMLSVEELIRMPRRGKIVRRPVLPDAKFNNVNITQFIGRIMLSGKRSLAERIVYDALTLIDQRSQNTADERLKRPAIEVFEMALRNAAPNVEVKPRRVGGATYQVPIEIRRERRAALAMRWLIAASRARKGRTMSEKLASELMDAAAMQGATIRKKDETHKMAESNKAFASYKR
jgi:small subunit ribosomal protein S7